MMLDSVYYSDRCAGKPATYYFEPVGYLVIGGILGEKLHVISENAFPEVLSAYDPSIGVVGVAGSNPVAPIE